MPAIPFPKKLSKQWVGEVARPTAPAVPVVPAGFVNKRVARPKDTPVDRTEAAPKGDTEFGRSSRLQEAATASPEDTPALDAWHASYTDLVSLAALRTSGTKAVEMFAPEMAFADDDRQKVADTRDFPWPCICSLDIVASNGTRWVGTGFLVGPKTVITAGHCVYLHRQGGWARSVKVVPGRNGATAPFGEFVSTGLHTVTGWTDRMEPAYDYGAVLLAEPLNLGWFAYGVYPTEDLQKLEVNLYGYPADKPQGELWGTARVLQQVLPQKLVYNLSTFGGQSGAPVYEKNGDQRIAVGIHNYGDLSGNSATRITDGVYDDIDAWKN